jgi:hypothetical protein
MPKVYLLCRLTPFVFIPNIGTARPYGQAPIGGAGIQRDRGADMAMVELVRTNELVLLSWLLAELASSGIEATILDVHTSILEGSISAIPRRVMVDEDDMPLAARVLEMANDIGRGGPNGFE